jgi:hypothetical protein
MAKEPNWAPEELRVVDRHLCDLGRGTHADGLEAARACIAELGPVWEELRPGVRRTLLSVHQRILIRARESGLSWARHKWTQAEVDLVEPYAQAYMRGEYPSMRAAARACYGALPLRFRARRASWAVYQLLFRLARRRGQLRLCRSVGEAENEVLNRYVRALHEGRYKYVRQAAPDCWAKLERLRLRRPDAEEVRPRTPSWVRLTLAKPSAALGLPRYRNFLTPMEHDLLEHFARKVDAGESPDWLTAAKECLTEIKRRYARRSWLPPGGPRRLTSHSIHTLHTEILDLAHRLNLRGPRCIRWSEPEMKLLESWLRWYARHRQAKKLRPMKQAAEGLQEDLEKLGNQRTTAACSTQLWKFFRLREFGGHSK